jgi:hypothetical protein
MRFNYSRYGNFFGEISCIFVDRIALTDKITIPETTRNLTKDIPGSGIRDHLG